MKQRYLGVTFRCGKPLAAYLYLPRAPAAKAARTTDEGRGLRVDFDANSTAPQAVTIAELNAVLARLGLASLPADDWAPLRAA